MHRMRMACAAGLLLALTSCAGLAAQDSQHPHTVDRSAKPDWNGTWVDDAGREWEIRQEKDSITLTSKSGAAFEGPVNGYSFEAYHQLTFAETRKDLPVPVRKMITGETVTFEGKISYDGESISGTYIDKDPDWLYYKETDKYVIKELRDGRTGLNLHRPPDIHIGRIRVDYEAAKKRIREMQQKINDLDTEIQAIDPLIADAQARYQAALGPYRQAQAAIRDLEKKIAAAQPNADVQAQIDYLEALKYFQELKDAGADASDPHQRDLLLEAINKKDTLLKQLKAKKIKAPLPYQNSSAQLQAKIDALEKNQGVDKKALYALEDQLLVAQGAKNKAETEFDLAAHSLNRLTDRRYPLATEKDSLEKQIANARREGDAQLTAVNVTGPGGPVYSATWWDPWDRLQEVNNDIGQINESLQGARHSEEMLHDAYVQAQKDEMALGREVETAIWKSMWAQYGLEVADLVGDMVKNSLEEGAHVGILHAVAKKFFDCGKDVIWAGGDFGAIGGYEFMDEDKIREEMLAGGMRDKIDPGKEWDEVVKSDGKELANTAGTKLVLQVLPKTKDVVKFVAERSKIAEEIVIKSGAAGAKQAARRAVDGMFKEVALKRGGSDMALDIFKDYAKGKLKEGAREAFEGQAWRDYFNAEFYRQALHQQWMGAVARVHGLERFRAKLQFVHDEILHDYEQNDPNHYKGAEAAPLKQKKDYTAHLQFKGAQPSKMDVHFGNAQAQGSGNDYTFNTGHMKGTVDVYVNVLEY